MSPHTFPLRNIDINHIGSTQLSDDQMKAAKKRIRAYDRKDELKFRTDEAKNNFESILYSFRDWLQTEENLPFVGEEKQETIIAEILEHLDWLDYGEGDTAGYEEFEKRYN